MRGFRQTLAASRPRWSAGSGCAAVPREHGPRDSGHNDVTTSLGSFRIPGVGTCAACAAAVPEGARFCLACGAPVEPPAAAEERKLVTVVFADLVGSTALADAEDPERTRAVLARFY